MVLIALTFGSNEWSGPYQNQTGSDGIGDDPYTIDANNIDRYPLMLPFLADMAVVNLSTSKTVVGQNYSVFIDLTVENQGNKIELFNVTAYANETTIDQTEIILESGDSESVTLKWNATGVAKGNYTIRAIVDAVLGETDTADNNFTDGWVIVAMVGDVTGPDGWPDGKVDIRDLAAIARVYGAVYPDPHYNANYDLTGPTAGIADKKIDIRDIALTALHYGDTDP